MKTDSGFVYFIRAGATGSIKIGWAIDPAKRLEQLQTGNPQRLVLLATIAGAVRDEQMLHRRFAALRLYGEWFSPDPSLLECIAAVSDGKAPAPITETDIEEIARLCRLSREAMAIDHRRLESAGIKEPVGVMTLVQCEESLAKENIWFEQNGSLKAVTNEKLRNIGWRIWLHGGNDAIWSAFHRAWDKIDNRYIRRLEVAWEDIAGIRP